MLNQPGGLLTRSALNVAPGGAPPALPLDTISGAVAAYSLRRLRTTYAGSAIRVRRDSDSTLQDIGFSGNDLDLAGYGSFVGAANGFVAVWYDQSGGGHDASNLAFATQPQVILHATSNGLPALYSASTSVGLGGTVPAASVPLTFSTVASRTGGLDQYSGTLTFSDGANPPVLFYTPNLGGFAFGNVGLAALTIAGVTDNQFHVAIGVENAASSSLRVDSASTSGTLSSSPGGTNLVVPTYNTIGMWSEAIYFNGALSAGNIATLAANQKAYWGTP